MAENILAEMSTEFAVRILKAGIVSYDSVRKIFHDCGAIRRMLIASINTAKETD